MGITGPACFGFERLWFSRSIRRIVENPDLFEKEHIADAQYSLGLGNRQVLAVEYWLKCARLIQRDGNNTSLSGFGDLVWTFDSQLEEPETWFAIHYHLASARQAASTYWFAFQKMPHTFSKSSLREGLKREFAGKSPRTYKDAISVFFSIMTRTEINTLCNMVEVDSDSIVKTIDPPLLESGLVAYAVVDWATKSGFKTSHFSQLLSEGGPAKSFSLTSAGLAKYLDQIQEKYAKKILWVSRTAGLDSVTFAQGIPPLAVLRAYYLEHLEGVDPLEAINRAIEEEGRRGG